MQSRCGLLFEGFFGWAGLQGMEVRLKCRVGGVVKCRVGGGQNAE